MSATLETFEFQSEARQLLNLMIHSVYSNREIFLRELISNASDAMDRRRFEAVTNPDLMAGGPELEIFLEPNKSENTLTIHDRGIGMSRDEVIGLIGTIAKSGTKDFMKKLQEAKTADAPELIGQFGVGFYSSFMVADKVALVTRKAGEEKATKWESAGEGTYTLEEVDRDEPGTSITLHLTDFEDDESAEDYTEHFVLQRIVKKYSDFVAYPIKMNVERTEIERDDEGKPVEGAEPKTIVEEETLNSMKAIWLRDKDEVSEEELNEFYKHISHDWNEPLDVIRAKIEGMLEYRLLLFIPSQAPFDLFYRDGRHGLQLYVKRVFIMDDCKELMPEYLRFVRGVVDSEDLSLNISREILQQNKQIQRMRKGIVGKTLDALKTMCDKDNEKFRTFWTHFGRVLKEGIYHDQDNRDVILSMMYAASTNDASELTRLDEYIERMKPGQEAIYFMCGDSREAVENSPHLEAFKDKGYEVLILTDPVDEIWVQGFFDYKGKKFQSVSKGEVDLGTEDEKKERDEKRKEKQETYKSLLESLQGNLDEHVKEVRLSDRLTSSAVCLVGDESDLSPQLEEMMRAMNQEVPKAKRILEVNPNHPILEKLKAKFEADANAPELKDYAELLYGQALLAEGGKLPDAGGFARRVAELMVKAI